MKRLKSLAALLVTLAMLFSFIPAHAVEADEMVFTVSNATVAAGETAEIIISIENNPGVTAIEFNVDYPDGWMDWVYSEDEEDYIIPVVPASWVKGTFITSEEVDDNPAVVYWMHGTRDYTKTGTFVTITFTVPADAEPGVYPITITNDFVEVYNIYEEDIPYSVVNGSITIECDHSYTEKVEDAAHLVPGTGTNCLSQKQYYYDCAKCDSVGTTTWTSTTYGDHSYIEKVADDAHQVPGSGANCQEQKAYYYDCAYCTSIGTTTWTSESCGDHSYTEKVEDAAHLVSGTGVNCQSLKEYYFDCAYCDSVGTATWTSESCGEHVMSTTWTSENDKHFHECTVCGCDHIEDEANCSGGTATCTDLAVCAVCAKEYGDVLPHDFSGEWNEGNAAGHWHVCLDCGAKETPEAHIPGSDATEDTAQTCSECGYIITPALHVHELTAVEAVEVSCTDNGHEAYFYCACGAWYTDEAATHLVTDKGALVIEATGHDWLDVTCTAPKTCADCGATEGSALGHTDADNNAKCDTCGHQEDSSKPGSNTPQTGDNNHILFAVSMMAICLVAFIALICGKKRSK